MNLRNHQTLIMDGIKGKELCPYKSACWVQEHGTVTLILAIAHVEGVANERHPLLAGLTGSLCSLLFTTCYYLGFVEYSVTT